MTGEKEEILVVKKDKERMKFKVTNKEMNRWSPNKYQKIIKSRDFNELALLFYDLYSMNYPVERAYFKFKSFFNDPSLFFLK